ncbi:MAG: VOC family protein [Actinomycetota bacterium]|nr:VOC family protein [Actinomycetota bacterium]
MDLASVRVITANLDTMVTFYEQVTGVQASRPAPTFAELRFPSCTLALGDVSTTALFNDAAQPAANKTVIIEWIVTDVDAEFQRLQPIVSTWEQEPTQMPWGNKSILFRDPDGNLINLFTPISPEAIERFSKKHDQ